MKYCIVFFFFFIRPCTVITRCLLETRHIHADTVGRGNKANSSGDPFGVVYVIIILYIFLKHIIIIYSAKCMG